MLAIYMMGRVGSRGAKQVNQLDPSRPFTLVLLITRWTSQEHLGRATPFEKRGLAPALVTAERAA